MFFRILILSYTIPAVYLFFRVWHLFIDKRHRSLYFLLFALVFLVFPASRFLRGRAPFLSAFAEAVSNNLLPVLLYIFLGVLLTDILLLINFGIRVVPAEKLAGSTFRYNYFLGLIIVSLLVVVAGKINFNTIRTSDYPITVPPGKSTLTELRIAFVSDFHLDPSVPERFVKSYVRKIRKIRPDVLFYGGDIVEGNGNNIPEYEELLRGISVPLGVYGVMGNHDRFRDYRNNFFTRAGITLLLDSVVTVNGKFSVAGRIDGWQGRKSAARLAGEAPEQLPLMVLDHRPTDIEQLSRTRANIVFSGHTHNGQLFPLNLYMRSLYELSYGHMLRENTHFFVSSGLRLWGPRVRTTGKSEIVVVNVKFSGKDAESQ